ncbi:hypothetical protein AVEN_70243-1 [Araneus ventricosus]|uniref:Uncharacterized protein n=1 Tax=Araneus ventricosus TaxID=182803 RepID=A0A4Y2GBN6_ARAVE|nr:hypothetical protein AVEN_70243-1 [Araneus ventricosus]
MSDNRYFPEQESSSVDDPLQSGASNLFPQGVSSQVAGFGLPIALPAEELTSRMENPSRNLPASDHKSVTSYLSLNDISIKYWQLYAQSRPESYDFAMNIMAYVELLNDSSWKATVSYFDENVKRMVTHIWKEKQVYFNKTFDLQTFHRDMILKLMGDFTQWSINQNFDLYQFLNYCVLMCHLGVIARKCIFKDAPCYAIGQLRERIKLLKFENVVQFTFEIVVKEFAKRMF